MSDIFCADDIRNALMAANEGRNPSLEQVQAALSLLEDSRRPSKIAVVVTAYRAGHAAALTTVALAFGLSPAIIAGRGEALALGLPPTIVGCYNMSDDINLDPIDQL